MKYLILMMLQVVSTIALAGLPVAVCEKSDQYQTGNPDFQQDSAYQVEGRLSCDRALPKASDSYEVAVTKLQNNICHTLLSSQGEYEQFAKGFDRTIFRHEVYLSETNVVSIRPHRKCIKMDAKGFVGGSFCAAYADAPELGFEMNINGLRVATNSTEDLAAREFEVKEIDFNSVEVIAGNEKVTVNGQVTYAGAPLRDKYSPVNFALGEKAKNLSYDFGHLRFAKNNCLIQLH